MLHHEVRHLVYGHPFINQDLYEDKNALTIAMEVTVNEQLPEQLPAGAIFLEQFPDLKPDTDTITRHHQLAKSAKKEREKAQRESSAQKSGSRSSHQNGTPRGAGKSHGVQAVDCHERWKEIASQEAVARTLLEATARELVKKRCCTRCKRYVDPHLGAWHPSRIQAQHLSESFRIPQIITRPDDLQNDP